MIIAVFEIHTMILIPGKLSSKYNIHRAEDEENIVLQGQLNQYIDKIIAIIVL